MIETPLVTKDYKLRACGYKLEPAFESLPSLEVRTTAALHLSLRFTESSRLLRVKSRHAFGNQADLMKSTGVWSSREFYGIRILKYNISK